MTLIYPDHESFSESFSVVFLDLHRVGKETVGLGLARNPADGFRIPKWKEQVAGTIGEAFFPKKAKKRRFSPGKRLEYLKSTFSFPTVDRKQDHE